jgi:hypothetical protein
MLHVYTTYKGFGSIHKKPEIYALPLKRKSLPTYKRMDLVIDQILDIIEKTTKDGNEISWNNRKDIYWYIIGKQHTMESF